MKLDPEKNDHIRIMFKNGLVEEGLVLYWSDQKAVLKLSESILIIQNVIDDILAIKIFIKPQQKTNNKLSPIEVTTEPDLNISERDPKLRALKISELRRLQKVEEEALIRKRLTTFESTGEAKLGEYGDTGRISGKPPSIFNDSKQEAINLFKRRSR